MTRIEWHPDGRTFRRMILLGLSLILTVVTALTATGVAHASSVINTWAWNTSFGKNLYITTDGTTPYGSGESGNGPGRTFTSTSSSNYNDPSGKCGQSPSVGCTEFNLQLNSGYCLAAADNGVNIDIKPCNADGTVWALLLHTGNTFEWINVEFSNAHQKDYLMTSDNIVGDRLTIDCRNCHSGDEQQWNLDSR